MQKEFKEDSTYTSVKVIKVVREQDEKSYATKIEI